MQSLPQENLTTTEEKSSDPPVAPALSDAKESVDGEVRVNLPFPSPPRSPPSPASPTSPPSPVSPASPASPTCESVPGVECPAGPTESQPNAREPEERPQVDGGKKKRREEEAKEEVLAATSSAVMLTDACPKTASNYAYAR